jgi:hypothetical protein
MATALPIKLEGHFTSRLKIELVKERKAKK